jgi:hypothetical protein
MQNRLYSILPILVGIGLLFLANLAHAEAQIKEVCKDKLDKTGKVVMDKSGKPKKDCKKIKVHKKLEGTRVPEKK